MARSDDVQYKYREILIDPYLLSTVSFDDLQYIMSNEDLVDEMKGLSEDLLSRVVEIIDTQLTSRQKEVVQLIYFQKKTQMEAADMLGVCQTTVHKVLKGNIDYKNGQKRYGGAIKKIKKLCANDDTIQNILTRMEDIRAELY